MATTQFPADKYVVGGQTEIANWNVMSETTSIVEDAEDRFKPTGQFNSHIVYSRRIAKQFTLEATALADEDEFEVGGEIEIDSVDYIIQAVSRVNTRGPVQVTLDVITQEDSLEPEV